MRNFLLQCPEELPRFTSVVAQFGVTESHSGSGIHVSVLAVTGTIQRDITVHFVLCLTINYSSLCALSHYILQFILCSVSLCITVHFALCLTIYYSSFCALSHCLLQFILRSDSLYIKVLFELCLTVYYSSLCALSHYVLQFIL